MTPFRNEHEITYPFSPSPFMERGAGGEVCGQDISDRFLKILLVNPPCLDTRVTDEDALAVPIGLYYIGAVLKADGFAVDVINLAVAQKPIDVLKEGVLSHRPSVVAFSVLHANRHAAMDAAAAVKAIDPNIVTVFGGPAPTFSAEHFFKMCPALDFIIKGEGEGSFLKLVRALKEGNASGHASFPRQTVFNDMDGIPFSLNQPPPLENPFDALDRLNDILDESQTMPSHLDSQDLISDLDALPHPAAYFDYDHLSLSRGCPGKCRFCGSPDFWGKGRVRFHSPKWFVDEMALLVKRGNRHFFISDDTFTMDKKRVLAVCQEIIDRQLGITWQAISRVDFIDDDILKAMRLSGCIQISFGVESGSEKIRKALGKPFKEKRIIQAFHRTAAHGILPRAYFIYGSPGETKKSIQESVDLMGKIRPLSMISYILVLFPGTALYEEGLRDGIIQPDAWERKAEDIPWFEVDPDLDFETVRRFGQQLRKGFYTKVHRFAQKITLVDDPELNSCHADFLSRLAMTFSHGEYARHPDVIQQEKTAWALYHRALEYAPDARAYLGLAMTHQKHRDFKAALSLLESAIVHFPAHRQLSICMGVTLMNLGDFRAALHYLEPFSSHGDVIPYIDACHQRL